ncbi:hypothetical protein TWF730_002303 [Orbilia blumenaviensis]|uniref:NACHT domain-containing protein n=1 Tax=Orbilia blumenaviensis TaxID=1796055 RepID=A0AAV9UDZ4_9PEZI
MSQTHQHSASCNIDDLNRYRKPCRTQATPLPLASNPQSPKTEELESEANLEAGGQPTCKITDNANRIYRRPGGREDFQIAIICALPVEYNAVSLLIDQWWDQDDKYGRAEGDSNTYRNGRLGEHNVVLLLLPKMGKSSAAGSTASLRSSYYNLKLALLVGICGGVPYAGKREIILGDVVIGERIFQYDFGRQYRSQHVPKPAEEGNVGSPNKDLNGFIAYLKTETGRQEAQKHAAKYLTQLQKISIDAQCNYSYPGASQDKLFLATYQHRHQEPSRCNLCSAEPSLYCRVADKTACADLGCNDDMLVQRQRLEMKQKFGTEDEKQSPEIFVGNIASGDTVMRSSEHRDAISIQGNVIAFEMEGAGAIDECPSLVVKGVCDYADSHKNKDWQQFAAATAATVAKAILERYTLPSISIGANRSQVNFDDQDKNCLADLRVTNPVDDKTRIAQTKGGLLRDSYSWILGHDDFKMWNRNEAQVLWVTGDPGKGKTMLFCGLIEELSPSTRLEDTTSNKLQSYFFFQGTNSRLNNATAALRSLIYMLVEQHPPLIVSIRDKFDRVGKHLFQDVNAWFALSAIFINILKDLKDHQVCILIDALDECTTDLPKLLELVIQSSEFTHVKWILTSRNVIGVQRGLQAHPSCTRLSLELEGNAELVSKAVCNYIKHSISGLSAIFGNEVEASMIYEAMLTKSNGTFLWVSLVTQELNGANSWEVDHILDEFPVELSAVYRRMIYQIRQQRRETQALCSLILSTLSVAYRPLHLKEISVLLRLPGTISRKPEVIRSIVGQCGSFFTIRDDFIYIIHQSAMDFLLEEGIGLLSSEKCDWRMESHYMLLCQSLEALSAILKTDIYNLKEPAFSTTNIRIPDPDPLFAVRYSCVCWVDHFKYIMCSNWGDRSVHEEKIHDFLRKHFLHWLESLSLIGKIFEGIRGITLLVSLFQAIGNPDLNRFLHDANRFVLYFASTIQEAPLQTYYALSLVPENNLVCQQSEGNIPDSLAIKPLQQGWGPLIQILEGHQRSVKAVTFSPDGKTIASSSSDGKTILWDLLTGTILQQIDDLPLPTCEVAISPNGEKVLSILGTMPGGFLLWHLETGKILERLEPPDYSGLHTFDFATFSVDGMALLIAYKLADSRYGLTFYELKFCEATLGIRKTNFELKASTLSLSPNGKIIAYISEGTLRLWDISSAEVLKTFENWNFDDGYDLDGWNRKPSNLLKFSPDGEFVAATFNDTIGILNITTGDMDDLREFNSCINIISFSPDGWTVACALEDATVELIEPWGKTTTSKVLQNLGGHGRHRHGTLLDFVIFSADSKIVATVLRPADPALRKTDVSIQLWHRANGQLVQTLQSQKYGYHANAVILPPHHDTFILASRGGILRRWNIWTGELKPAIKLESINNDQKVYFSADSKKVALVSHEAGGSVGYIRLWNREKSAVEYTLDFCGVIVDPMVFSLDGTTITAAFKIRQSDVLIHFWELETGRLTRSFKIPNCFARMMTISPDGQIAALVTISGIILLDIGTGSIERIYRDEWHGIEQIRYSSCGKTIALLFRDHEENLASIKLRKLPAKLLLSQQESHDYSWHLLTASGDLIRFRSPLALSPDWKIAITTDIYSDFTMSIHDTKTGAVLNTIFGHGSSIRGMAFSPDGRRAVTGSSDSNVRVWEVEAAMRNSGPVENHASEVMFMKIAGNKAVAASVSRRSGIRLWDTITGRCLHVLSEDDPRPSYEVLYAESLSFSPDGTRLAYKKGRRIILSVYNTQENSSTNFSVDLDFLSSPMCRVNIAAEPSITFSSDGREFTFVGTFSRRANPIPSHTLLSFDSSSGKFLRQLDIRKCARLVVISPTRNALALSINLNRGLRIQIQAIEGPSRIKKIDGFGKDISKMDFSPDGRLLIVRETTENTICDVLNGTLLWKYPNASIECIDTRDFETLTISPDMIYLRTGRGIVGIHSLVEWGTREAKDYPVEFSKLLWAARASILEEEDYPVEFSKALSAGRDWIAQGGRKIMKLPMDFHVSSIAFQGDMLMLGTCTGRVLFVTCR